MCVLLFLVFFLFFFFFWVGGLCYDIDPRKRKKWSVGVRVDQPLKGILKNMSPKGFPGKEQDISGDRFPLNQEKYKTPSQQMEDNSPTFMGIFREVLEEDTHHPDAHTQPYKHPYPQDPSPRKLPLTSEAPVCYEVQPGGGLLEVVLP